MKLLVKKLSDTATIPTVAHPGEDLGYDLYSDEDFTIEPNQRRLCSTGVSVKGVSDGSLSVVKIGFIVKDRSSVSSKFGVYIHAGVIDSGYTGEVKVLLHNTSANAVRFYRGERIAQIVPIPVLTGVIEKVDDLGESLRGDNGFGSSGV